MLAQSELEKRLRDSSAWYDRGFPTTAMLERRVLARMALTPREDRGRASLPLERVLSGLVVAMVALALVGVVRLRNVSHPDEARAGSRGRYLYTFKPR